MNMNLGRFCAGILFMIISLGLQLLYSWIIMKSNDDGLIVAVLIFLFNVIAPVVFIYRILLERGLI